MSTALEKVEDTAGTNTAPAGTTDAPPALAEPAGGVVVALDHGPPPWGVKALLVLSGIGAVLIVLALAKLVPHTRAVEFFGAFLIVYAAMVGVSWLPPSVLSRSVDEFFEKWVKDKGKGFYGVMALAVFCVLEAEQLFGQAGDVLMRPDGVQKVARDSILGWVMGFSLDSLLNGVWAAIWPWIYMGKIGMVPTAVMAGAAWCVYFVGSRVFPGIPRLAMPTAEDKAARKLERSARKAAKAQAKAESRAAR